MIKTINKSLLILSSAILLLVVSCSKKDFDDNYYNPEASVTGDVPRVFSGMLYNHSKGNANTILPRYWNMYVFKLPMPGKYSQTFGYTATPGRYDQATAYNQLRWSYYYTAPLASFREMERLYNGMSATDKEGYKLFYETGKIFLYDQTAEMIDMWGNIPFEEAGQIVTTQGNIINGKFDDQEKLYMNMLDDLKQIADYLNAYTTNTYYKNMFDRADLLNYGSVDKWKIYANSLRLRLAMRISYYNEAQAKAIATEILNNPGTYPVVTTIANSIKIDARGNEIRSVIGVDGIKGIYNSDGYNYAPGYMVNTMMKPNDDPRLRVLFAQNAKGEYLGLDPNISLTEQEDLINANLISRLDSATFNTNDKFPGIMITPAEIYFLKAEANERWGIGTSAEQNYLLGITRSIEYWYYVNSLNDNADGTSYKPLTPPSETEIATFLAKPAIAYTGTQSQKLEKIASQNWLNFGPIQAQHAWAEYRRTKYPALTFISDPGAQMSKLPPTRLLYPENERTYNSRNYEAVKSYDLSTNKIFWDVR